MYRVEIRAATTLDEVSAADALFDGPSRPDWSQRFLDSPDHHLLGPHAGQGLQVPDEPTPESSIR